MQLPPCGIGRVFRSNSTTDGLDWSNPCPNTSTKFGVYDPGRKLELRLCKQHGIAMRIRLVKARAERETEQGVNLVEICMAGRYIIRRDRKGGLLWDVPCERLVERTIQLGKDGPEHGLCGPHAGVIYDDLAEAYGLG